MSDASLGDMRLTLQHLRMVDRPALLATLETEWAPAVGTALRALVEHALQRSPNATRLDEPGLGDCLRGWTSYFGADYTTAGRQFEAAWRAGGPWSSWAALGLCKVSSDLGYWARARDWGLVALDRARRENDFERLCEAAGAVGEVFLRAGHPKLAYELISLDAALLPPGSGHRDRLSNYLAVCLGRLGQFALAESMLWHNYFAAREHAPYSASFSCASLYVLSVLGHDHTLFARLETLGPLPAPLGSAMADAFVACVRAYWCRPRGPDNQDPAGALAHLEYASALFAKHYPVELWWVSQLEAHVSGQSSATAELEALRQRPAPARAPQHDHVLDARHATVALDDKPFPVLDSDAFTASPWAGLRLFFI